MRFVVLAGIFVTIFLALKLSLAFIDVGHLRLTSTAPVQLSWEQGSAFCDSQAGGGRLATIYELIAIDWLREDVELVSPTDYWSSNNIGGWAFGYNTKSHILSFDHIADTDHVICVALGR